MHSFVVGIVFPSTSTNASINTYAVKSSVFISPSCFKSKPGLRLHCQRPDCLSLVEREPDLAAVDLAVVLLRKEVAAERLDYVVEADLLLPGLRQH